ncbi:MAG: hypothetical protein KatS3mg102_2687 [Planctomycetota bacterium]|nr:MAG: hypothetical protein KatS3mg102_2687 [Planctomycetota bacterium]
MNTAQARAAEGGQLTAPVEIAGRTGLSRAEVLASRREHGPNVLTPPPRTPWWRLLAEKFDDPVIRILMVAAALSFGIGLFEGGHAIEALGILIAALLATTIAFFNEYRAGREFELLTHVSDEVPVKVLREGAFTTVPRREVVVGDLVIVETGDEVPADGELIEAVSLLVDESRLTGESVPAPKHPRLQGAPPEGDHQGAYPPHRLLRSTLVVEGHGVMVVDAVGDRTEIGRTAQAAMIELGEPTPLGRQLEKLSKLIGVLGFLLAGLAFAGLLLRGTLSGDLVLKPHQWWFQAAVLAGAVVALQRLWLPVVYDALELLGRQRPRPAWLRGEGGARRWLYTVVAGAAVFGAALGALLALGLVPAAPTEWIDLEDSRQLLRYFMVAVVIIVVAVPEGLPMSVTLSLAYSMRRLAAANNLVRRMHACETIGAATVILTDKTGTLTLNRMRVVQAWVAGRESTSFAELAQTAAGRLLAEGVAVNSTANLAFEDEHGAPFAEPRPIGNPTEGALLVWLAAGGVDYRPLRRGFALARQWPFSTQRKFMATAGGSERVLHLKGAPEILLERSSHCLTPEGSREPLGPQLAEIRSRLEELQRRGMRTIGFAVRRLEPDTPLERELDELAQELDWLGFVAIADPVRPDVPAAIAQCRAAGIEVKIVTGDTPATAREIARQIGLLEGEGEPGTVMTGPELAALSDPEATARLGPLKVLARARPADKLRAVRLLQRQGHVVAVTGDGTNDAPALNQADVGLAMGRTGTAVAKEAADIVLLDDSFPSIVNAVRWGRGLYANIQRFLYFQLTINVTACLIAMLGPYIGVEMPLTVMQMLWVNLIMDTFAALALATEPPREEVMQRPPRRPDAFIITPRMAAAILGTAAIFVPVLVLLLKTRLLGGAELRHELTLFFNFFVLLQLFNLFNARALDTCEPALRGLAANPAFLGIACAIALGQVAIVQLGGEVFRTVPLGIDDWVRTAGLAAPVLVVGELLRRWRRRNA